MSCSDCATCGGCPDIYQPEFLNATCGRENEIEFYRHPACGFPCVRISTPFGVAEVSLYGAHVLSWVPACEKPVLFLARNAVFKIGKAIRGGIPVCWPWFGGCKPKPEDPAHGFARISFWNVLNVGYYADGRRSVSLVLNGSEKTKKIWDYDFELILTLTVGCDLKVELTTKNTGKKLINMTEALHSYLAIGDESKISVSGLENNPFLDATENFAVKSESEAITFNSKTDRVYTGTHNSITVDDIANNRKLLIEKSGSQTTVVWNPGADGIKDFGDLASDEYKNFVCIEPANAFGGELAILPGESHTLTQTITIIK